MGEQQRGICALRLQADNERSYQLREVAEANARVQKGGAIGRQP